MRPWTGIEIEAMATRAVKISVSEADSMAQKFKECRKRKSVKETGRDSDGGEGREECRRGREKREEEATKERVVLVRTW